MARQEVNTLSLVMAAVAPHPPIIVPEVGGPEVKGAAATCRGLEKLARQMEQARLEALVIISPHAPVGGQALLLAGRESLQGNLARFGASQVQARLETHGQLLQLLEEECGELGVPVQVVDEASGVTWTLDHGILVPWYYLERAGVRVPVVVAGLAPWPPQQFVTLGQAVARAAARSHQRIGLLASGDLSHRLTCDAPAGYSPRGADFDRKMVQAFREWNPQEIIQLDRDLAEAAGECGWRPLLVLAGACAHIAAHSHVLSYEAPFGVGYLVAAVVPRFGEQEKEARDPDREEAKWDSQESREQGLVFLRLARQTLETYAQSGREPEPPGPLPRELETRTGCFVSLKKEGQLRGCMGTITATRENLAREIMANAVAAGFRDPRFPPLDPSELSRVQVSVDVLGEMEPVSGRQELDPRHYGLLVRSGSRSGVLLPDLEGVDTPEQQLLIARRKAGIDPDDPQELFRFRVERFAEAQD